MIQQIPRFLEPGAATLHGIALVGAGRFGSDVVRLGRAGDKRLGGEVECPGGTGMGFIVNRRGGDAVHGTFVGIDRAVARMGKRKGMAKLVMENPGRCAAADTGETTGLATGGNSINIGVIQADPPAFSGGRLESAIPCESRRLLAVEGETGLRGVIRL